MTVIRLNDSWYITEVSYHPSEERHMAILSQRFHYIKTKFRAVTTYRTGRYSVYHICTKYHISKLPDALE